MRRWLVLCFVAGLAACVHHAAPSSSTHSASGRQLLARDARFEALTRDGFVVFSEPTPAGGRVAKLIHLDGTGETVLAEAAQDDKGVLVDAIGSVVFVWTDRGNRMATLTVWSPAAGVVRVGPGVRPGRGAATADGQYIGYVGNVGGTDATLLVSPTAAAAPVAVGTLNAADSKCWRNVDLAFVGSEVPRFVASYCPSGVTTGAVRSSDVQGGTPTDLSLAAADAQLLTERLLVRGSDGELAAMNADGSARTTLTQHASSFVVSRDQSSVAVALDDGSVVLTPSAGPPALDALAPAGQAKRLGALAPDHRQVLYASQLEDRGSGQLAQYTDVLLGRSGAAPLALEGKTTSCPDCLADSFTPDSTLALAIDPIDNSASGGGAGMLSVFDTRSGELSPLDAHVWTALALPRGSGHGSVFLLVDVHPGSGATPDLYDLDTRTLEPNGTATTIARGVEWLGVDHARSFVVYSLPGSDRLAGVWVALL